MPEPRAELLSAMQHYEGGDNPNATSSAGAIGPMQVMPSTAKLYGVDPSTLNDPGVNIQTGSHIMGDLIDRYHGNERAALMAYRQGTKSFDAGKIAPGSQEYADSILSRASVKLPSTDAIDQAYAARKQDDQDIADGRNAIAADPEGFQRWLKQTGRADATPAANMPQPPKSPEEAAQQQSGIEQTKDLPWFGTGPQKPKPFSGSEATQPAIDPTFMAADAISGGMAGGVTSGVKAAASSGLFQEASNLAMKATGIALPNHPIVQGVAGIALPMLAHRGVIQGIKSLFGEGGEAAAAGEAAKGVESATTAVKDAMPSTDGIRKLGELPGASSDLKQAAATLQPAVRDPETGKVFTAPDAKNHGQVYDSLPPEVAAKEKLDTGFVGADGEYMTRQQTHDHLIAAQTAGEPAAGAAAPTAEGGGGPSAAPVNIEEPRPEFVAERMKDAGNGPPGLSVEHPNDMMGRIVYRNPAGQPVGSLEFDKTYTDPETGNKFTATVAPEGATPSSLDVQNFAVDKNRGLLASRAAVAIGQKAKELGINPGDTMSSDAARFLQHAQQQATAEVATPEAAAQTLAQRQIANLQATRVGKEVAAEFTKPELDTTQAKLDKLLAAQAKSPDPARYPAIQAAQQRIAELKGVATTVPEALTMQESQGLRQNLESYYAQGSTPPKLAANVQALASTYHEENLGIHALNEDLRTRAAAGEDVTADGQQLLNRWSAYAENISTLEGTRSDVGRSLQILDPNKPNNQFAAGTAKIAQMFSAEQDGWQKLSDLLHALPVETRPRVARQMGEDASLGRNVYNALHEYYVNNLLSDVGRTGSRIGLSNVISVALTIPRATIESLIPGSQVKMGEDLARFQGAFNGLWHAVDVFGQSAKTGARVSQIEGGTVSPFVDNNKAISGQAFGLDGTGLGTAVDYLGNVLRLPGRGITAVHQFTHSVAYSMNAHALVWRQAVNQAQSEGLSGLAGYRRAQQLNDLILKDLPAEIRQAAGQMADKDTFANMIDKPPDNRDPQWRDIPYYAQQASKVPFIRQLNPFMRVAYNVKKMGSLLDPTIGTLSQIPGLVSGDPKRQAAAVASASLSLLMGMEITHQYHQGNVQLNQYNEPEFVIGDHRVQVPPVLDVPYGIIGNYMRNIDSMSDPEAIDHVTSYVKAVGTAFSNDSVVQSMVNIRRLWTDVNNGASGKTAIKKFLGQEASGLIPWSSLLHAIASGQDVLKRNPQTAGLEMQMSIPKTPLTEGRQDVTPDTDIFNQPVPNPIMGFPKNLIFPVNVTEPTKDPVVNEISRLGIKPVHVPAFLDNYPKDKAKWQADRADGLHDDLSEYMNSKDYKTDNDLERKTEMEHILAKAANYANTGFSDKMMNIIAAHKDALKGYAPDMVPGQQQPVTNEFGEAGPAQTVVPAIQ